jgi:hypothetical protein
VPTDSTGPFSGAGGRKSSSESARQRLLTRSAPKPGCRLTYITIMIMEKLATKVAMDANAAISRRRSVIVVSRVRYVFILFCFRTQVKKRTKRKRRIRDILRPIVNEKLTPAEALAAAGKTCGLKMTESALGDLGFFSFGRDTSGASN